MVPLTLRFGDAERARRRGRALSRPGRASGRLLPVGAELLQIGGEVGDLGVIAQADEDHPSAGRHGAGITDIGGEVLGRAGRVANVAAISRMRMDGRLCLDGGTDRRARVSHVDGAIWPLRSGAALIWVRLPPR